MAIIQEEVLAKFYTKLAASGKVDAATVDALRKLFESGKKLKGDDFVAVVSKEKKGDAS